MNKKLVISFLLTVIAFVWAGSFIVVKTTIEEVDPIQLGFLRFLVATPLMILILLIRKKGVKLPRKKLPSLFILGLTGVTLLYLFQFVGIDLTNASTSAVLINTNVIFILLLSTTFLHEQLSIKKIVGIIISFLGVVLIMFSNMPMENLQLNNLFFLGCIFILLSALCWAIYSIVGKRLITHYDAFTVTTYAFLLGMMCYLPFVIMDIHTTVQHLSLDNWLAVLYLGLICSVFGYLGWYYALQHIEASKAAVFLNFIPFFAILLSILIGEVLTFFFLLGAILIIYGVYLTQKG